MGRKPGSRRGPVNIPLTNITIPVFNRPDETLITLASLREKVSRGYVVTVVDNGSDSGLNRELQRLHSRGVIDRLLVLDGNYGVSCASNVGWSSVQTPFFMKLDNDVRILSSTFLEDVYSMWGRARHSTIIGPAWNCREEMGRTVLPRGILWTLPVSFYGNAFFVSARIRDTIGYFSEDYGLYGEEDADYCMRCHYAGIRKYSFEASGMLEHMNQGSAAYVRDKKEAHSLNVGTEKAAGIFALNLFLYRHGLRPLRVPLKYRIHSCRGLHVTLEENPAYGAWFNRLQECLEIYNMSSSREVSPQQIEKMRAILCPSEEEKRIFCFPA